MGLIWSHMGRYGRPRPAVGTLPQHTRKKFVIKLILLGWEISEQDGICGHGLNVMRSTYPVNLGMYCFTPYSLYSVFHYIVTIYSIFQVAYSILPDPINNTYSAIIQPTQI